MPKYSFESWIADRQKTFEQSLTAPDNNEKIGPLTERKIQSHLDAYKLVLKLLSDAQGAAVSYGVILWTVYPQVNSQHRKEPAEFDIQDMTNLMLQLIDHGELQSTDETAVFELKSYTLGSRNSQ